MQIFDDRACILGEGPLWHPERRALFWFDILGNRLMSRDAGGGRSWAFDEHVSAAGWIDAETLLVASETALFRLDLASGARDDVCPLEADNLATRSNDGRADPWGGFWIGTMGKGGEDGAGAIYRFYRGELRRLIAPITVSNAICFDPGRRWAHFADTRRKLIWRQALDARDGWPNGEPEAFIDLNAGGWKPDGAVIDADGNLYNAQWGGARIAVYDSAGTFVRAVPYPAAQITCPAFGGDDLTTLFATSASNRLTSQELAEQPDAGRTFALAVDARGQAEHRVIL